MKPLENLICSGETPFTQLFVVTADTYRLTYLMNALARKGRYTMLVGSGSGKTCIINQYLRSLDKDVDGFLSMTINMSYYTDSKRFQNEIELNIDKRSGKRFGPPATKRLIVFIDDMNLPYIETYGTQNSIAFLTQHMSYTTIFDRVDLGLRKELVDIQYVAAMNATAGSFTICERAQRHFATFACLMPSKNDLTTIYKSLMGGHVKGFDDKVEQSVDKIVEASIHLYEDVQRKFLPSAAKFTYNWSLRELTNVFQGVCLMRNSDYSSLNDVAKIWVHEFCRGNFHLNFICNFHVLNHLLLISGFGSLLYDPRAGDFHGDDEREHQESLVDKQPGRCHSTLQRFHQFR
jgi:dynein heavy chain, axonemal